MCQPYAAFVQKEILKPLQLQFTYTDYRATLAGRIPTGYSVPYNQLRRPLEPRRPTQALAASVGVYATTDDTCRFAASQCGSTTLLSDRTKQLAYRTQASIATGLDSGVTFGLGFRVKRIGKTTLFGHDGHLGGHSSATFFEPRAGLAVSIAANAQDAPVMQMMHGIWGALYWFDENIASSKDTLSVRA